MMYLSKITCIARPLDPRYQTNLGIMILAVVAGAATLGLQLLKGTDFMSSSVYGLQAGLVVFFAWAFSREIDPDHELSAFVSALLVFPVFLWAAEPNFGALLLALLLARIINRTFGPPATILDSIAILGLGSWFAFREGWLYGFFTALAFVLDSGLHPPNPRNTFFAGLMGIITVVSIFFGDTGQFVQPGPDNSWLAVILVALLFVPLILSCRETRSVCDLNGEALDPRRIQVAQIFLFLVVAAIYIYYGLDGAIALFPLWVAIIGVSIFYLFESLAKRLRVAH